MTNCNNSSLFTINSINMIGIVGLNVTKNTDCSICKCNLNNNSIYNLDNSLQLKISEGICGHQFHFECIARVNGHNKLCPNCLKPWILRKIIY